MLGAELVTRIVALETLRLEEFANLLWVRVHTDDGLSGLGETFFGPQAVEAFIHETAAPILIGQDAGRIEYLNRKLQQYVGFRGSGAEMRGLSALDIALWDLWGKRTDQPLWQLMGGRTRDSIRTYNTCAGYRYIRTAKGQLSENWGVGEPQGPYEDLDAFMNRADDLAHSLLEDGITAMKIWPFDPAAEASDGMWLTADQMKAGLAPFEKIRNAVGDRIEVMLECHSLWDLPTALMLADRVREYRPYWIEDPIRMDSLDAIGEFRARCGTRVTASETIAGVWGFRDLIAAKAADVVMLDLGWVGGVTQARKAAHLAEAHHLPIAPHDCTGPVVWTASTHLSLSAPNAMLQESVRAFYTGWYKEVATALPSVEKGFVTVPDGPGLGMELLPDLAERPDARNRRTGEADL
ncbi:mandelate racemase/muconate lactonizing enzyme family protein [Inquilinus sp. CAU 1745]